MDPSKTDTDRKAEMKRVVVIGAGVSGLTAGIYLLQMGYAVTLLEKNPTPGGELTGWEREGFVIDNCVHWAMGARPGSALHEIWENVDFFGENPVTPEIMYISTLGEERIVLRRDIDRTEREMIALSPEDRKEIRRLFRDVRTGEKVTIPADLPPEMMGAMDGIRMIAKTRAALHLFSSYKGERVSDVAARFCHPLIRKMLSDFTPAETPGYNFAMAYGNFVSGDGALPEGGSKAAALRMTRRFKELGGVLVTSAEVEEVRLEGENVFSVRTRDQKDYTLDYLVPACDLTETYFHLLPEAKRSVEFLEMIDQRDRYPVYATFQCAFALESDNDPLEAETMIESPLATDGPAYLPRMTVKSYGYESGFSPEGFQIVQTLQGGGTELYDWWKEQRSLSEENYREKKEDLARKTRESLERHFPDWKGKLRLLDCWTPLSYEKWTHAWRGFYQAPQITPDSRAPMAPSFQIEGIRNLILAGQWLSPPGGLPGAAIQGKYAALRLHHLDQHE